MSRYKYFNHYCDDDMELPAKWLESLLNDQQAISYVVLGINNKYIQVMLELPS